MIGGWRRVREQSRNRHINQNTDSYIFIYIYTYTYIYIHIYCSGGDGEFVGNLGTKNINHDTDSKLPLKASLKGANFQIISCFFGTLVEQVSSMIILHHNFFLKSQLNTHSTWQQRFHPSLETTLKSHFKHQSVILAYRCEFSKVSSVCVCVCVPTHVCLQIWLQ